MEIIYQLKSEDYRQGFIAMRRRTAKSRWGMRLAYLLLVVYLVLFFVVAFAARSTLSDVVIMAVLLLFWVWMLWYNPYKFAKKAMKDSPIAQAEHSLEISDTGIDSRTPLANSSISWDSLVDWVEGKTVFAIFLSSVSFFPIPKRAMTDSQQDEFRNLLRDKVRR